MIPVPEALAVAFAGKLTISAAELCELMPMDDATLRRHVKAGHIAYLRIGMGPTAPRRFTLNDVMQFLEGQSQRECPEAGHALLRTTPTTSQGGGIDARLARRNAEKQRQKAEAGVKPPSSFHRKP